ncbi:MAG: CBS domain-containing protein [Armatimonadota bacterium]
MNINDLRKQAESEKVYYLSEIINRKVVLNNKKTGRLLDIVIIETGKVPEATFFLVGRPFGQASLMVPWEKVKEISNKEIVIDIESQEKYEGDPKEEQVLLRDHILDKKVLDFEDNEVEVVYDIKLVLRNNKLYVTDVDFSRYGLLRRIGLKGVANFIYNLAEKIKEETISWTYIQPLPEQLSSFKGNVRLKVLKEKLPEIHPVDLADMLEELEPEQRLSIFNELESEQASDTLEEIEPRVQRDLIASIKKERAAELINLMTPAQAADVLVELPGTEADEILELIDKENADKIQPIMDKHDEKILNFSTPDFIKFNKYATVRQVLDRFRMAAKDKDVIMYIYVLDDENKLVGVVDIRELLQARLEDRLENIMTEHVISLEPDSKLSEASHMFNRYSFRAIPIVDEADKILGIVMYRDIMNLKHRFLE